MITLEIEPYCENCSTFDPVAETQEIYADNEIIYTDTKISCIHKEMCKNVARQASKIPEGEWIWVELTYTAGGRVPECSLCNYQPSWRPEEGPPDYCPKCGARMHK